nr:MAG TPA: hypothetical protein [Caudoviricetes sp.]
MVTETQQPKKKIFFSKGGLILNFSSIIIQTLS